MADLFDYLFWRGDLSFSADPFNEIDGMIAARLSYLPFEKIINENYSLSLFEAAEKMQRIENLYETVLIKSDFKLISALKKSARFKNAVVCDFIHNSDKNTQTQFCAVTLEFEDFAVVCFRGTDNTVVGWKEDLNMGLFCPVPAQRSAENYLKKALEKYEKIIVTGHSKGGNLAVFSSVMQDDNQDRILSVYNYDGPGFDDSIINSPGYKNICGRVKTFVPQSSVIGMLLGHKEKMKTVKSDNSGIMQHDIYSWNVGNKKFPYLKSVDSTSIFIDNTLKKWLSEMTKEEFNSFVEAVFTVMSETNFETLREMGEKKFESTASMLKSVKNLDEDTRKKAIGALTLLLKSTKSGFENIFKTK